MSDELEKKVDQLVTDMAEIKVALKGYDNKGGLINDYEKTKCDYFKFKKVVLCIFFFLLGSGALGLGGVKIAEVLAKGG